MCLLLQQLSHVVLVFAMIFQCFASCLSENQLSSQRGYAQDDGGDSRVICDMVVAVVVLYIIISSSFFILIFL